jgi:type II secretory pathway pseudopilin PulG
MKTSRRLFSQRGISLIELTIMLVVVGILMAVAMKNMTITVEDARRTKTEREMEMLANAIVGDPSALSSSHRADFGYVGDVGAFPPNLAALKTNPGFSTWDGPYVPAGYAEDTSGYRLDEWGSAYSYSGGLTITSSGHGTPIVKKIADATPDYLLNSFTGIVKDASDSLPGSVNRDSVEIEVTIPNGSGSTLTSASSRQAAWRSSSIRRTRRRYGRAGGMSSHDRAAAACSRQ